MSEKKRNFLKFIKSGTYTDKSGTRTNTDRAASRVKKIDLDLETMKPASTKKMLTGGQAKIAAKAPPPNKIDAKDFAVLRAEKAKGRGMGLQDEKVKPGKVMKANLGLMFMKKAKDKGAKGAEFLSPLAMLKRISGKKMGGVAKYRVGKSIKVKDDSSFSKKMELQDKGVINKKTGAGREKITKALKATRVGKMLLPVAVAGVAAQQYLKSKMKKKDEPKKKMGGGMMKKYSKGGGSDMGKSPTSKMKVAEIVRTYALANSMKDKDRLTDRDIDMAKKAISRVKAKRAQQGFLRTDPMPKKMGGGMMQKPMGYSKGVSVKARGCKLGRTKPTKIT